MGEIRVRLYGALSQNEEVKKDKSRIKNGVPMVIDEPISIKDALTRLNVPMKDVYFIVINKERVKPDREIKDGETVHVFPKMLGG